MPEADVTTNARAIIIETIQTLMARRGAGSLPLLPESKLAQDLGMDSLELAELSAVLEDEIGYDPYSEGIVPQTMAELFAFYD